MATDSHLVQFFIIDGPSLDTILEVLKRGTSREMSTKPYFVVRRAEHVLDPDRPHRRPKLMPIKDAKEERFIVRNVESVDRIEGNFLYSVKCLIDESNAPVTFIYIVHGRIGGVTLDAEDISVRLFLQQN